MNKTNKIIIISITVILLITLPLIFLKKNIVNLEEVEKTLLKEYELRKLEMNDISNYFGISEYDPDTMLFLTDFEELDKPFSPNTLIVIINNRKYKEYYNTLKEYIEMEIYNSTQKERIELYKNAIIKASSNCFYLIISNDNSISKLISKYYK